MTVRTISRGLFRDAPGGFIPPPLHPEGVELETRELGPGTYALLSGRPAVDNAGFVVGKRGVLVIDAHINGEMARQIQDAVREVTELPILYLVNTNYHGDHTFGNYAFPAETCVVAHSYTEERMRSFDEEREFLLPTVDGDREVFSGVQLRLPDLTFDTHLQLDIGDRLVELCYFGPGNTAGDTVVYVPDAGVAWTGNLVLGEGSLPPVFEGGAGEYLETIAHFERSLEVRSIVPGHGTPTTAAILGRYMRYLSELMDSVRGAVWRGWTLDEALDAAPLGEDFMPLAGSPFEGLRDFLVGLHRLNVQQTYLELKEG